MKRKRWPWILAVAAAAAAIVGGVSWDLRRKASGILRRHQGVIAAKLTELHGRSWPCAVLFDEELPGNRWDATTKALDAFDAIPDAEMEQIESRESTGA